MESFYQLNKHVPFISDTLWDLKEKTKVLTIVSKTRKQAREREIDVIFDSGKFQSILIVSFCGQCLWKLFSNIGNISKSIFITAW